MFLLVRGRNDVDWIEIDTETGKLGNRGIFLRCYEL